MNYETLKVEQRDMALFITLNRPQARNAMSLRMVDELNRVFQQAEQTPAIRPHRVLPTVSGHLPYP